MPDAGGGFFKRFLIIPVAISIAVLALLAYSNTLTGSFLFDDHNIIKYNKSFPLESFWPPSGTRYFAYLSFALNYSFNGEEVFGYHAVNLAIHIINGILVFIMARLLMSSPRLSGKDLPSSYIAALAALLFVAHPVQTEAVSYITQRFASLASLFYLSAVALYLKWRLSQKGAMRHVLYVLAVLFAYTSQMAKEICFTLPFVILMIELAFFNGPMARRLLGLVPFLLAMAVIPYMLFNSGMYNAGHGIREDQLVDLESISRHDYLVTQFRVVVTYLRLLVLPVGQRLEYDYPMFRTFFAPEVLASFILLLTLFAGSVFLYFRSLRKGSAFLAVIGAGVFWFFTTISVESSIVPIKDIIFEHRLYLPSVGAAIAVSAAIFLAARKAALAGGKVFAAAVVLLVLPLAVAAHERNKVWQNAVSLYEDTYSKSPNVDRVTYNLALAYHVSGNIDGAVEKYREALRLKPDLEKAHFNLGIIHMGKKEYEKAFYHFSDAVRLKPENAYTYFNLGNIYAVQNDMDRAITAYLRAVDLQPNIEDAHFNLAVAFMRKGDLDEAESHLQTVLRLNPNNFEAMSHLDELYSMKRD